MTNISGNYDTGSPLPASDIDTAVGRLRETVDTAHQLAVSLTKQLSPVLRPEGPVAEFPTPNQLAEPGPGRSDLASRLHDIASNLEGVVNALRSTSRRCDL